MAFWFQDTYKERTDNEKKGIVGNKRNDFKSNLWLHRSHCKNSIVNNTCKNVKKIIYISTLDCKDDFGSIIDENFRTKP
jgi:hypothetical protein